MRYVWRLGLSDKLYLSNVLHAFNVYSNNKKTICGRKLKRLEKKHREYRKCKHCLELLNSK